MRSVQYTCTRDQAKKERERERREEGEQGILGCITKEKMAKMFDGRIEQNHFLQNNHSKKATLCEKCSEKERKSNF